MSNLVAITGAGGGIGRALAPLLAAEGYKLLLIDLEASGVEDLAKDLGAAFHVGAPVSPQDCAAALEKVDGPIYGLVHLAGVFEPDPDLAETPEIWRRAIDHNLDNAYNFTSAMIPRLPEDRTGRIVYISSLAFRRGGTDHIAYSAAKGGLVGMTRALARRLGPRATVNALAPGIILTRMPAEIIAARGDSMKSLIPLGRYGEPSEVATVIRFLVSDDASFITGQCLNVDGGHDMA